jgi:hypothetical protein
MVAHASLLQVIAKQINYLTCFIIYHRMISFYDKWKYLFTLHFDVSSTLLSMDTIDKIHQIQNQDRYTSSHHSLLFFIRALLCRIGRGGTSCIFFSGLSYTSIHFLGSTTSHSIQQSKNYTPSEYTFSSDGTLFFQTNC